MFGFQFVTFTSLTFYDTSVCTKFAHFDLQTSDLHFFLFFLTTFNRLALHEDGNQADVSSPSLLAL